MPYRLRVTSGKDKGTLIGLDEGHVLTLGRSPSNDICITDHKMSRIHCQIELAGAICNLTDLNSTNGTFFENDRIDEVALEDGDSFGLGFTTIRFERCEDGEDGEPSEERQDEDKGTPAPRVLVCNECGREIPEKSMAKGEARQIGSGFYCAVCSREFADVEIVDEAPPQEEAAEDEESEEVEARHALASETQASLDPLMGQVVAGNRITDKISEGPLGSLYQAEQASMKRTVALRILRRGPEMTEHALDDALDRIRSAGRLCHPNIVVIHDVGQQNNLYYVSMEYVEGESVRDILLKHKRLVTPEDEVVDDECCFGLVAILFEFLQRPLPEHDFLLAAEVGGQLVEDAALLREVANLVEEPLAILGSFDPEYLRLPESVLLAVMRARQRYLPVTRDGALLPYFIAVANGSNLDVVAVRQGNEAVLLARYADAAFFYQADTKAPLSAFTPRLDTLTFQEQLGSVLDKVRRLEGLVPELAEMLGLSEGEAQTAARAAALCKSDLATQMVVELTSLQGVIGRHYAAVSGEPEAVAQAIEEHYLPRFNGDRLPETRAGVVVGLADRLDTLVGLFAVGIRPSGAADPWGLRRAALGLVQLLVGKELPLALPEALSTAAERLPLPADEGVLGEVLDFIAARYQGYLRDSGFRYDLVDAVLAERGYDLHLAYRTLQAFIPWVEAEGWQELLDAYARCVRITRDQEEIYAVNEKLLVEPASLALYNAYLKAAARVAAEQTIDALFGALTELKPFISRFFDDVLVMVEDPALRRNRLALLQAISALSEGIVDLTLMEGF